MTADTHAPDSNATTFRLRNIPSSGRDRITSLRAVQSCNASAMFQPLSAVPVAADGTFSVVVGAGCVLTLTSHATKGVVARGQDIPPSQSFPTEYFDDFESYQDQQTVCCAHGTCGIHKGKHTRCVYLSNP